MIDYTLPLEELPDPLPIEPLTKPFDVTITPPGSKSITCRAYVLAALAEGESNIIRPLRADDTDRLLDALCTLGAEARWEGEDVFIKGVGGRFPRGGVVNLGDGGTPARFMIAAACLAAEPVVVDGSKRMRERPIAEGVDMLRQLGATIEYVEEEGRLPVRVVPSDAFKGGEIEIGTTQSSQFISALMLIAPSLLDGVRLYLAKYPTSASYIWLTIETMHRFSAKARRKLRSRFAKRALRSVHIPIGKIKSTDCPIEIDASSATYWAMATLMVSGSIMLMESLPVWSRQPDLQAIKTLWKFGAVVLPYEHNGVEDGVGIDSGHEKPRNKRQIDCSEFPDGAMALAIAAAVIEGTTYLHGLHTLRVKETDRLAALENELTKIGCTVSTTVDSITITPPSHGRDARATEQAATDPVVIETYNDHRMAMAFAVLGLARPGISIANPKCVAKSYPGFWKDFAKLYQ